MIRLPSFQRPMARLALIAMLLLVALPTVGRIVHAAMPVGTAQAERGGWAAMCSGSGLKYVAAPFALPSPEPAPPAGHAGTDCDYCPLLASLLVVALWLALALPAPRLASAPMARGTPRRFRLHPCGLGSRGPPLAL